MSDDEVDETARMASFEALNPHELAAAWLTGDPDATQYCFDLKGEFFVEWLAALISMAEGDDQIGFVAAGPVEASMRRNIKLASELEARVPRPKLRAVLERMWYSGASVEVKEWARQLLDHEQTSPRTRYPHGLVE